MTNVMTKAMVWVQLREFWLKNEANAPEGLRSSIRNLLTEYKPCLVPDTMMGDSGYVSFDDGSQILWDWDNGDFECGEERLSYPFNNDDPLFWE
jgi:hypothetical protein